MTFRALIELNGEHWVAAVQRPDDEACWCNLWLDRFDNLHAAQEAAEEKAKYLQLKPYCQWSAVEGGMVKIYAE